MDISSGRKLHVACVVSVVMGSHQTFRLFRDRAGDWCAAPPGFHDLLHDPIGRGSTRAEAVRELLTHPEFIHRAKAGEWPLQPRLAAFVEVLAPHDANFASRELLAEISSWNAMARRRTLKLVWKRER